LTHTTPRHATPHRYCQAGVLQYARAITEAQAGETVVDAVITVPVWWGVAQRSALLDAAKLAGLNVLGLISTHAVRRPNRAGLGGGAVFDATPALPLGCVDDTSSGG
jgi:allophanate hydrolase subunit 1